MQFPIVLEYKEDILRKNLENIIYNEPITIASGLYDRVFSVRHAPFFIESLSLTTTSGEPLYLDKDYEIFNIMPKLTGKAGQGVSCLIKMLNPLVTTALATYHTVGSVSLVDSSLLGLFASVINDERPISFENIRNKPLGFVPNMHGHSLIYEIFAFQDTITLLSGILTLIKDSPDAMKLRLDHYLDLIDWYIDLYGGMLNDYLDRHSVTYDSHGLTAKQVGLDLVDNYETATQANILQARSDQHLLPTELKTLIESYSFNTDEFLASKVLPIAQYGNSNFIPPNIDGSFEGFGGVVETGGMCLENDSSIVFLWNRMDGRTRGLYYSVLTDSDSSLRARLTYTGFKYTHPKILNDRAEVDYIAGGSGGEVILVGDSRSDNCYIGLTNGSLDPTKHVYSKVNMRVLLDSIFPSGDPTPPAYLFRVTTVLLMGDWVYLVLSSSQDSPTPNPLNGAMVYKQFFRVSKADIMRGIDVVPVRQNVSYTNADGEVFTNARSFKWYSITQTAEGLTTKGLFTFYPEYATYYTGNYRSQLAISAEDPDRSGIFGLKFLSSFYAATASKSLGFIPEITYDFNPTTGVMTLKSKSNIPPTVNFADNPVLPPAYALNQDTGMLVASYNSQGVNLLDDGRVVSSGAEGFNGFPRLSTVLELNDSRSKYASIVKEWTKPSNGKSLFVVAETITSPVESSINVKGVMYKPGVEYYLAAKKNELNTPKLFRKAVTGKLAIRPEVTNTLYPNLLSRPLTSNIRPVNAITGLGGITVTVPSAQLDSYNVEVAESAFCMGAQKKYYNRSLIGNAWGAEVGADDIIMTSTHTDRLDQDGSVTIVPDIEILYPAAIVERLKDLVENKDIKNRSSQCIVTVSDPSFSNMGRFGWLPVIVNISYRDGPGRSTSNNMYNTWAVINPTYNTTNKRKVLTNFNVVNIFHSVSIDGGINELYTFNGLNDNVSQQTTVGPMRTLYYVDGDKLKVFFSNGVVGQTTGDNLVCHLDITYETRTNFLWSSVYEQRTTSFGSSFAVTPDNGIKEIAPWNATTGGAGSIVLGNVSNVLIGSLYPEVGWTIFFKSEIRVVFNGEPFILPAGSIDLRDINLTPQNRTFYIYAKLESGVVSYDVSLEKRLESNFQLWVGAAVTNDRQIITLDRFNVTAIDGHRISETRRGNSIPASSGLITAEGQLPWLKQNELLP